MAKIIAIFNQKGGVGKTTTNINLGAYLAKIGKKVLLVDIDPQGNTTSGIGIMKRKLEYTVYDSLIEDEFDPHDGILHTAVEKLDILPASVDLAGAEIELVTIEGRERRLKDSLAQVDKEYDYIFIDCPPSLGLLTINALVAANQVLIPIQCEFFALEGLSQLTKTIELIRKGMNPDIEILGVVLSMFDGRTNLSIQVVQEVKRYFGNKVFNTVIPKNVTLAEAPSYGMPVLMYDMKSKGSIAYFELAKEFLQRERKSK